MNLKRLNTKYALLNAFFMVQSVASYGFSYNYLSQRGFAEGLIGIVLSLSNLLIIFVAPLAGDLIDRSDKITQKRFVTAAMLVTAAMAILMALMPDSPFALAPAAVLCFSSSSTALPIVYSMAFDYEHAGGYINYGLCRSFGSASYAVSSIILGRLWAAYGYNMFTVWTVTGIILTVAVCNLMPDTPPKMHTERDVNKREPISLSQYFSTYPATLGVFVALVLLYFCHMLINNYMGAVIGDIVPKNEVELIQGNTLFIQALAELPAMACFSLIMKRFTINQILAFAAIAWTIKHVLILFATTVPMLYFAMLWQMLSFAVITPATVYFANNMVHEADRNKSQAIFNSTTATGAVIASFAGGWLIQMFSIHTGLVVGIISSTLGTIIMIVAVSRIQASDKNAN